MLQLTVKQQAARVMAFAKEKAPKVVSYQAIMFEFDIGRSKAMDLCRMAGDISNCYTYDRGKLKYTCESITSDPEFGTFEENFPDGEKDEKSVELGVVESIKIHKIFSAQPAVSKDKGFLKTPRKLKEDWDPNDFPN